MPFDQFMTDTIDIIKQNGEVLKGLKASVQSKAIYMDHNNVLVEPADLIRRQMSNGAEETYEVVDPGFNEACIGFAASYQMQVRKLGLPEAKQRVQSITYNVTGNNARVNHNSVDNSVNQVVIDGALAKQVETLRQVVQELSDEQQRATSLELVTAVEQQLGQAKPPKAVVAALLAGLPHVESITAITASILGML